MNKTLYAIKRKDTGEILPSRHGSHTAAAWRISQIRIDLETYCPNIEIPELEVVSVMEGGENE